MDGVVAAARAPRAAALTLLLLLPACITRTLWGLVPERPPQIHTTTVPCVVSEARQQEGVELPAAPIHLALSPVATDGAPALLAEREQPPIWLTLQPPVRRGRAWLESSAPRRWSARLTQSDYQHRAAPNAGLTFTGMAPLKSVCQELDAQTAARFAHSTPLRSAEVGDDVRRCLAGFARQPWYRLLTTDPGTGRGVRGSRPVTAVGWLDPEGEPLARPPVQHVANGRWVAARPDVAECSLVGRIESARESRYFRVPVSVALAGEALSLAPTMLREQVHWQWFEVWSAEFRAAPPATAGRSIAGLLTNQHIVFNYRRTHTPWRWDRELVHILSPFTRIIDYILRSFEPIAALLDALLGEEEKPPARRR